MRGFTPRMENWVREMHLLFAPARDEKPTRTAKSYDDILDHCCFA
jgi:hypothetical protein